MSAVNVYQQYFEACLTFAGIRRHAALVSLICESEEGNIRYDAAVSFFPYNEPDVFAVSYDAYFSETVFEARGRRSSKREAGLLEKLWESIDRLAEQAGGEVFRDRPLSGPRIDSLTSRSVGFSLDK